MKTTHQLLPDDCLLDGRVHPSIAERLERVKQLPVAAVANYLGLHQENGRFWLKWQAIEGRALSTLEPSSVVQRSIADQLRHIVDAMHSHGIVHGAITPSCVVIDAVGRVHLTHVSPLLYDDPQQDLAAIARLFAEPKSVSNASESIVDLKRRQWLSVLTILAAGLLMFFGLLWYSQPR